MAEEGESGFSRLKELVFGFSNSGMTIHRSNGDMGEVTFVASSYSHLMAEEEEGGFWQLAERLVLRDYHASSNFYRKFWYFAVARLFWHQYWFWARSKLKMGVGLLLAMLTSLFSTKVAATTMPAAVKLLVCLMAVASFNAFFLHWNRKGFVLATLRLHSPQTAGGGISLHDPRETAWSRARLIVDSGATRHAVGNILLLEGFQPYRPPLVATLADGSHLRIFGIGRIQRGNFSIPNVSLVEGVQDGLISTPQLDALHGLVSCFGNGMCRIMEADGTEVGGAVLEEDGSYVLRFLEVPGTAQV